MTASVPDPHTFYLKADLLQVALNDQSNCSTYHIKFCVLVVQTSVSEKDATPSNRRQIDRGWQR